MDPRERRQAVRLRDTRAAGTAELVLGRRVEPVTATELADQDKTPVLRAYLKRFGWEVGMFFETLNKNSTDAELLAEAPGFPVFRLQ